MKKMNELGVPVPDHKAYVIRNYKDVREDQRERALIETEYNMFSFPADLLTLDYLSDSGSTSMSDLQWAALLHGDESYGRNKGYYVLLDAFRDVFERGDKPEKLVNLILSGEDNVNKLMNEVYLTSSEGGFVNGGVHQLSRPNTFIVPQGRVSEYLLFSTLAEVLHEINPNRKYYIPNNGHFDTTGANIRAVHIEPINVFDKSVVLEPFPYKEMDLRNPFKGNMDIKQLEEIINQKGPDSIPLIYITITNNSIAGQPVSMANIRAAKEIATKYGIPYFFDACRFAENAYFIQKFEEEFKNVSIREIIKEMFSYVDGFTISLKKDGLGNMGGALFLRDNGVFVKKYSINGKNIGIRIKERQIVTIGNDSYGGLSGRDIMALAVGLQEVVKLSYLKSRIGLTQYFAKRLAENNIPVILPAGGHAVYIDMDKFFIGTAMKTKNFGGVGFTIELLKHYGIRACELGPFAFEWDQRSEEQRKSILNLVRFAIPRNAYSRSDIDYTVAAISELFKNKEKIPKVRIARGAELSLRHFQTGLKPIYPKS
ncbi:tryptophanase [Promethearchaeum syntrophicum]|uniref:Tryptophanase n=1 Tax=Promethearchaeum syntrophicum TaxID=2594042 RepID=A0A5B9DE05_9ARCH|nr:tryptophanase [Candidatus Prometheoarchaeum syntrophicum]